MILGNIGQRAINRTEQLLLALRDSRDPFPPRAYSSSRVFANPAIKFMLSCNLYLRRLDYLLLPARRTIARTQRHPLYNH